MSSRKHDDWITIRVSKEDRQELLRLAEAEERTLNGMVRLAIRELLEQRARVEDEVAA